MNIVALGEGGRQEQEHPVMVENWRGEMPARSPMSLARLI
jgi:hypothetical protein